jgi:hypothetical protein
MKFQKYAKRGHLSPQIFDNIMILIESHMGPKPVFLENQKEPISDTMSLKQQIVYLSDFAASRTKIDFKFD